jgi:hypothetical protein
MIMSTYNIYGTKIKKADTQSALPLKGEADLGASALYIKDTTNSTQSQIVLS